MDVSDHPRRQPVVLDSLALIPASWLRNRDPSEFHVYNPAIIHFRGRHLMAYRVDCGRQLDIALHRVAMCVLDDQFHIVPESVSPLSDTIRCAGGVHTDPRLLVHRDRLFVHFNNERHTRPNHIFMAEVDPDTLESPVPARPLTLEGRRQEIEKNWMLFDHDGELFAVYWISPHIVLQVEMAGSGPIVCRPSYNTEWNVSPYSASHGEPRGGAPPVRRHDEYVSFFHSCWQVTPAPWLLSVWPYEQIGQMSRLAGKLVRRVHYLIDRRRYYGGAYAFEAKPPFRPRWISSDPVLRPELEPSRRRPSVNPLAEAVAYPCGAISLSDDAWLVSYGVHDERCCLRIIEHHALEHGAVDDG